MTNSCLRQALAVCLLFPTVCWSEEGSKPEMVEVEVHFIKATETQTKDLLALTPGQHFGVPNNIHPAGILVLQGVFNAGELEKILTKLKAAGKEIASSPRTVTLSGRRATVENARELRYPSEFSKPTTEAEGIYPVSFETKNVGLFLELEPTIEAEERISLVVSARIVEFKGFIDSTQVKPGTDLDNPEVAKVLLKAPLKKGGAWQPILTTREVTTKADLYSGQTLFLSDLPAPAEPGAERIYIFITARVVPKK